METHVIVIGAGCAGLIAAIEAQREGADVVLIDRGPIGIGTNSALSNGVFAGPSSHYGPEDHVRDTLHTGKGLNREPLVRLMAQEAPRAFSYLRSLGLDLVEFPGGYRIRSPRPDLMPGVTLVKTLSKEIYKLSELKVLTGLYVTDILRNEEGVCGVRGFVRTGDDVFIYAPAIVLATGGAGAIYIRSDNQRGTMGQGYRLAAKAGLELWDMEFVQFYPLVIAEPDLPLMLLYPPYPEEARLINAAGEDLLKKHGIDDLNKAISTRRDAFSAILFQEGLEGPVYMDYQRVPAPMWERHPLKVLKKLRPFDSRKKLFAVSPAAHFFMGGVRIDEKGQTSFPGLFACGEVVWGLHGANRMRGNALTECVVFGKIAGRNAARYALTHRISSLNPRGSSKGLLHHQFSFNKEKLRELRRWMKEIAWKHAGVVRSEGELREGLAKLMDFEKELEAIVPQTAAERKLKEDLLSAAFVLKAVLTASLSRKESRGSFIREDFPEQDDVNWRRNSCLSCKEGENYGFSISYGLKSK